MMRFTGDARGYWEERVEDIEKAEQWDDGSPVGDYQLSNEDRRVILLALKRQFIAQKTDRIQVLHAYKAVFGYDS